jgi:hypothetical protein
MGPGQIATTILLSLHSTSIFTRLDGEWEDSLETLLARDTGGSIGDGFL